MDNTLVAKVLVALIVMAAVILDWPRAIAGFILGWTVAAQQVAVLGDPGRDRGNRRGWRGDLFRHRPVGWCVQFRFPDGVRGGGCDSGRAFAGRALDC